MFKLWWQQILSQLSHVLKYDYFFFFGEFFSGINDYLTLDMLLSFLSTHHYCVSISMYLFLTHATLWQNCNIPLSTVNHTRPFVNPIFSLKLFPWNSPMQTVWFLGLLHSWYLRVSLYYHLKKFLLFSSALDAVSWIICVPFFQIYCPHFVGHLL